MATVATAVTLGLLLALTGCSMPSAAPSRPADRMVNLGFEDVVNTDPAHLHELARHVDAVDATAVSIAVGRTDWTAFPWRGHGDATSTEAVKTGGDFVAEAIQTLKNPARGGHREVILTIDVLLGRALVDDPSLAGRSVTGQSSPSFPSVTALRHGAAGSRLASLAAAVAATYRPDAVNLTELMFDDFTFGSDDLADYRATLNVADWPRQSDGNIDVSDPRISTWRSEAMADIVRKVRAAVEPYNVRLEMDVRSPRDSASADRADSGQDYDLLLKNLDRLHVWEYVGLNTERSPRTSELSRALVERGGDRMSLSVGLWAEPGVIPPERFRSALVDAASGGVESVSVTPASLMTEDHWDVLKEVWNPGGS